MRVKGKEGKCIPDKENNIPPPKKNHLIIKDMTEFRLALFAYLLGYKRKVGKGSRARSHITLLVSVKDFGICPLGDRKPLKY